MEVQLTGVKTLALQSNEIAYILDTLAARPYKDVKTLIDRIFFQLKQQEVNREEANPNPADLPTDRVQSSGPADR